MAKEKKTDSRRNLALKSITYLFEQAKLHPDNSIILIQHAIKYKKRHKVSFTHEQKRLFCNSCFNIYNGSEKVRVTNKGLRIICPVCNKSRMIMHSAER